MLAADKGKRIAETCFLKVRFANTQCACLAAILLVHVYLYIILKSSTYHK